MPAALIAAAFLLLAPAAQAHSGGLQAPAAKPVPREAMEILIDRGIQRAAAAGIVGNALQESGWNPSSQGMGGGGLWGFTVSPVSLRDLQRFAVRKSLRWDTTRAQTLFLLRNLEIHDSRFRERLNRIQNPERAAEVFCWEWERPYAPTANIERRQEGARIAWRLFVPFKSVIRVQTKLAEKDVARQITGGIGPGCQGHSHFHSFPDYRPWARRFLRSSGISKKAKARHRHQVACAAGPNHREAMRSLWRKIQQSLLPPNHDLWVRIGKCEQPGPGYRGVHWAHPGPTYQGGLGFWYETWDAFKLQGMPANAGDASWRQQMQVANRLLARYGTSPWGCT